MREFSMLVGATKLGISLGGKPSVLSCVNGDLQLMNARNGEILLSGPLPTLQFTRARTMMISISGGSTTYNVFGYDRYTDKTLALIAERGLPPLVGAAQAATWFPDAFQAKSEFLSGADNVTHLLPRLLAENGVQVAER